MDIKVQTAKGDDWKIIQKLNNQVFLHDKDYDDDIDLSYAFSPKGIAYYKRLATGEYGKCFLAYSDDQPAGDVALFIKDFGYRKSKYVEIENIGVDPEYRSQGIGKLLIDAAVSWAKEQKATKLFVSAYWKNTRAVYFYKQCGFYEIGIELDKKI